MADADLIQQCKNGDKQAFGRLAVKYRYLVLDRCRHFTTNAADVQDLVQETFLRVFLDLHQLKDHSRFPQWLRQVTTRVCQMWKRKGSHEAWQTDESDETDLFHMNMVTPEQETMKREISNIITESIDELPDDQKTMMTLYYMDDWSYEEMSEMLDLPQTTIKTRLYRARRQLKRDLIRRFATDAARFEQDDLVARALDDMPENHRQLLHLYYVTGLSCREIASWLNQSRWAVWGQLFIARQALQVGLLEILEEGFTDESFNDPIADDLTVTESIEACIGESSWQ